MDSMSKTSERERGKRRKVREGVDIPELMDTELWKAVLFVFKLVCSVYYSINLMLACGR